jgi:hypothetical protein
MRCKHVMINQKERKCNDYYYSSKANCFMCRLPEWKMKKKVCPYDPTIFSAPRKMRKEIKDGKQKTLNICVS